MKIDYEIQEKSQLLFHLFISDCLHFQQRKGVMRSKWQMILARSSPSHPNQLWTIGKKERVCSIHFIDGEPSSENPFPTLHLGYRSSPRARKLNSDSSRRKLKYYTNKELHLSSSLLQQQEKLNISTLSSASKTKESSSTLEKESSIPNNEIYSTLPVDFTLLTSSPIIHTSKKDRNIADSSSLLHLTYNDLSTKSIKESYYNYETMDLSSPLPNEMSSSCNNSSIIFHGSSNDFDHIID